MKLSNWLRGGVAALVLGVICTFCFPISAYAAQADTWDGTADTTWYDASNPKNEYEISTAEQLAGLAELVNQNEYVTFSGVTVSLDSDLDLSGHEWTSIGRGFNVPKWAFGGTFDGRGHTISGLYSHGDDAANGRRGLFGAVYVATIKNIRVKDADIAVPAEDSKMNGLGILVDVGFNSVISGCFTSGSISNGTLIDRNIGGVVGQLLGASSVFSTSSSAKIIGNAAGKYANSGFIGGIVGYSDNGRSAVTGCWFDGEIEVNSDSAAVGGIIGYSSGATINNCLVATTYIGKDSTADGNTCWIAYVADNQNVLNCVFPADTKYASAVSNAASGVSAGLATNDFRSSDVLGFLNEHAPKGTKWVAGIDHPVLEGDVHHVAADYSTFGQIKKTIPSDLTLYTDESVANLNAALAAVPMNAPATQQAAVDLAVNAVEKAVAALVYKPADYTAVDAALAKVQSLNKNDYKDFSKVDAAVKAVVKGKNITEQPEVDAMAAAIEHAIAALEKKPTEKPEPNPEPEETVHTVTLVWGGGFADATVKVEHGKTLSAPKDAPALAGYTFTGTWYLTKAEDGTLSDSYDFSTPVIENLTLYAGWTKNSSTKEDEKTPQEPQKNDQSKKSSQDALP